MARVTPDLKVGVEINAKVREVGIVANWRAVRETERRPAIIFGTSSDRIGTPEGQSYYVTMSKSVHERIAPYVGVSYSGYEERGLVPFGVNVALPRGWSAMLINDGVHTHVSATYAWDRFAVTVLAVERKDFGVTVGARF